MTTLSFNRKLVSGSDLDKAIPAVGSKRLDTEKPILLKHTWALWEQLQQGPLSGGANEAAHAAGSKEVTYGDLTTQVAKISDVQTFWHYFMHLPQPSQILGESKKIVRQDSEDGPAHTLAALMFFKDEIRPEWEHEANRKGGHFQFTLQFERSRTTGKDGAPIPGKQEGNNGSGSWLAQTDEYWNNIVLGLIGGSLDPEDFVTGIRLVDKVKPPPRQGGRPVGHIRIEVWYRDAADNVKINALKEALEMHMKCRIDGTVSSELFPGYRLDMRAHEDSTGGHNTEDKSGGAPKPSNRRATTNAASNGKRFPSKLNAETGDETAQSTLSAPPTVVTE